MNSQRKGNHHLLGNNNRPNTVDKRVSADCAGINGVTTNNINQLDKHKQSGATTDATHKVPQKLDLSNPMYSDNK